MSDVERSRSRSAEPEENGSVNGENHEEGSPRRSRGKSDSKSPKRSDSRDRSRHKRSHRHRRRSSSRSRSRSPRRRSRSRSRTPRRSSCRHYSRSRSRSYSPDRRSRSRSPMSSRKRHIASRDAPPPSRCIGVFGLSLYSDEKTLSNYFSQFGKIEEIQLVYDKKTGRSRGFGFIYYETTDDALNAKERAAGVEIDGHRIRVDFSITKRPHTPTPGIYMGKPTRGRGGDYRRSPSPYYKRSPSPYYSRRHRSRSYS